MIDLATFQRKIKQLSEILSLSINEVRVLMAIERIIARVEQHEKLRDILVFKGGYALFKLAGSNRFTRDLDALITKAEPEIVIEMMKEALRIDLNDRIKYFEPTVSKIIDQGPYGGYRMNIPYQLGDLDKKASIHKLSRVHLDLGIGDIIPISLTRTDITPLMDSLGAISWKVYPLEFIFSEKLQSLVVLGSANSRAKDIYDLVLLYPLLGDKKFLIKTIVSVFANRRTEIPDSFRRFFEEEDHRQLGYSWGSVLIAGKDVSFDSLRVSLIEILDHIDDLIMQD